MSRIIKNSIEEEEAVQLGKPLSERALLKKETLRRSTEESLDFSGGVESVITSYKQKIDDHFEALNKSIEDNKEEAYKRGYQKGFEEGLEKEYSDRENYIDTNFSNRIKTIESLLEEAKRKQEHAFRGLEKKVIALSICIAEKLIRKNFTENPSSIETVVTETMSYLIGGEKLVLKVSSDDFNLIKSKYDTWLSMAGNVKELKIEIDKTLNPGDCLIETEGGVIDATLTNRLEILAEEFLKVNQ